MKKHKAFIITLITMGVVSVYLKLRVYDPYLFYGPNIDFNPFAFIPEFELIGIIIIILILVFLLLMTKAKRITKQRTRQSIAIFIVTFFVLLSTSIFYYWPHIRHFLGHQTVKSFGQEFWVDIVLLSLNDGFKASDAEELAEIVNGRIVYEYTHSQLFVIELDTRTAKDLDAVIETLQRLGDPRIEDVSKNYIVEYSY